MDFNSLIFLIFIFIVFSLYYSIKAKFRYFILFIANIIFALTFIKWHFFIVVLFTIFAYASGFLLEKNKKFIFLTLLPIIGTFILFKYFLVFYDVLIPVGISFYTFKILSYLFDIYYGKIKAEYNFIILFDYITFFPTFLSGPISRFKDFIDSSEKVNFDYKNARDGALLFGLGIFEKMVIADSISFLVNKLYESSYSGLYTWLAILLYTLQIYTDFDSYSNIAIGLAKILGINIKPNFKTPLLSNNLKTFWNRWHISLSTWFKDYVYIPLGGNKKGKLIKAVNVIIVFLFSGLWHGSTLNFAIWGLGHGILVVAESSIISWFKGKDNKRSIGWFFNLILVMFNYLLVSLLFIFFKFESFSKSLEVLNRAMIFKSFSISDLDISFNQAIFFGLVILWVVISDLIRSRWSIVNLISKRNFLIRWLIYILLIALVLVFGSYGSRYNPSDFIYRYF